MGRNAKTTVEYFPHFVGSGKKMYFIENKYGNDGYATWYKLLEKIAETDYHYLDLNKDEEWLFLSSKCKVSEHRLLEIINDLTRVGAFDKQLWENKILWSKKFIDEIEEAYKRRNNKCMQYDDLCKHLIDLCILKKDFCKQSVCKNPQSRVDKSRVEDIIPPYREFKHLKISVEEFEKLKLLGYSKVQIDKILDNIQNYAKNKSYTSLYLTAKNWLEREYPIQTLEQDAFLQSL